MDRIAGDTVTLSSLDTTGIGFQTLLTCDGSVVPAAKGLPNSGGDGEKAPGVFTIDGDSSLQFHDAWVQAETRPVEFTLVSSAGGVYVGLWDTSAFGDKDRRHCLRRNRRRDGASTLLHSPDDFIQIRQVETARDLLERHGARVQLTTYAGGHGWHGDVYGTIRRAIDWLEAQQSADNNPRPAP